MKLPWQKTQDEEGNEKLEVTLPDDVKKQLDAAAGLTSKFDELVNSLKGVQAFVDESKADKERERAAAAQKQRTEANESLGSELQDLILTDPAEAIRRGTKDTNVALMTMRADMLRRETFEDEKRFPYYSGEIKVEIDKLLAGQTLALRNDPGVIENAYFATVGRMSDKIREGTIKDRFASAHSTRGTSTGNVDETVTTPPAITDDVRRVAKMLGFDEKEYAKMLQEEGIGYV